MHPDVYAFPGWILVVFLPVMMLLTHIHTCENSIPWDLWSPHMVYWTHTPYVREFVHLKCTNMWVSNVFLFSILFCQNIDASSVALLVTNELSDLYFLFCFTLQTFKWEEYLSWRRKAHEAKASAAALKASISGLSNERKPRESKWKTFFRRSRLEDVKIVKDNIYDKGFLHNLCDIIFPLSTRPSFSQAKSKSKSGWER